MPTTIDQVITDVGDPTLERLSDPPCTFGGDENGTWARCTYRMRAGSVVPFIQAVSGRVEDSGTGYTVKIPLVWPDWANPAMYATAWSGRYVGAKEATADEPAILGTIGENAVPAYAEITLEFRTPTWDYTQTVWSSRQVQFSASAITIPGAPYREKVSGKPINQDVAEFVPEMEIHYTRHWVPSLDYIEALAAPLMYTVNSVPIGIHPAGTLLFGGLATTNQRSMWGDLKNEANLVFHRRKYGWNWIKSDHTGTWVEVERSSDGGPIYEAADPTGVLTL